MAQVTFRNPPDRPGGNGPSYTDEAAQIRANPGQWGIIKQFPYEQAVRARTMAARINTGVLAMFRPAGAWSARTAVEDGEDGGRVVNVYACFGPPSDDGN